MFCRSLRGCMLIRLYICMLANYIYRHTGTALINLQYSRYRAICDLNFIYGAASTTFFPGYTANIFSLSHCTTENSQARQNQRLHFNFTPTPRTMEATHHRKLAPARWRSTSSCPQKLGSEIWTSYVLEAWRSSNPSCFVSRVC